MINETIKFVRTKRRHRNRPTSRLVRIINLIKCLREGGVSKEGRAKRYGVGISTIEADFLVLRLAGFNIEAHRPKGYWKMGKSKWDDLDI